MSCSILRLIYELAVLKPYVEAQLFGVEQRVPGIYRGKETA